MRGLSAPGDISCRFEDGDMKRKTNAASGSLKASMLKWTLSGGAFAAVVMTTGGCADFDASAFNLMGRRHETAEPQPAVRIAQNDTDAEQPAADDAGPADGDAAPVKPVLDTFDRAPRPAVAPQINIFGEFNG